MGGLDGAGLMCVLLTDFASLTQHKTHEHAQHKADPAVQHALEVRRAWSLNNYHRLGRLSRATPHLGRYIIEHFMGQVRLRALQAIVKA